MSYKLIFDENASVQLEKLPFVVKARIFKKLQMAKENPFHFFEKLEGRPEFKLRVGDYRIIADINNQEISILVVYVGHRRNVYSRI